MKPDPEKPFFTSFQVQLVARIEDNPSISSDMLAEKICSLASDRGRITVAFISAELKANRNTINKHLQNLVGLGRLVKHGKGRGTYYSPF